MPSARRDATSGPGASAPAEKRRSRARTVLWAALVVLLAYVVFGDKPWDPDVAERIASGKPLRAKDWAARYEWWAALANALLVAGLLATERVWGRPHAALPIDVLARPPAPARRHLALVALAALALGLLAWPRLGFGLWDDEARTARNAVAGFYEREAGGALRFRDVELRETLWAYDPNNHVPYSAAARLTTAAWRLASGASDRRAPEPALRLPAFGFGLAAVACAFALCWRLGDARAGLAAAWLLALHPWTLRYASEARGYTLLMALATAAPVALLDALHAGRWRAWGLFAGAELVMLWCFPPSALYVALLNAFALTALVRLRRGTPDLRPQLARWLVSGLVAGMALLQLALPNVPQLAGYLHEQSRALDARFAASVVSYFFAGEAWSWRAGAGAQFPELASRMAAHPVPFWGAAAASVAALVLGAWRLLRRPSPLPGVVGVLAGGAPLALAVAWLRSDELYVWHLSYLLAPLACLAAFGMAWPAIWASQATWAAPARALPLVYVAAFAAWTAEPRAALRARAFEPVRDSVALTRPLALDAPGQESVITASFSCEPFYYDPYVRRVRDVGELEALVREADATGRTLYVNLGRLELAAKRRPELLAYVERTDLFEETAVLAGLEPKHTRRVYRHAPVGGALPGVAGAPPHVP